MTTIPDSLQSVFSKPIATRANPVNSIANLDESANNAIPWCEESRTTQHDKMLRYLHGSQNTDTIIADQCCVDVDKQENVINGSKNIVAISERHVRFDDPLNINLTETKNHSTKASRKIDKQTQDVKHLTKPTQTDEEKLFIKALGPFIVQAVSATLMVFLDNKGLKKMTDYKEINPMLTMFLRIYLNVCWHGYGKKTDKYVVETFDKIFSHKIIKGAVCLIDWIDVIGRSMINVINLNDCIKQLRTMDRLEQRNIVTTNMEIMYAVVTSEMVEFKCTELCQDYYDNDDFFITDNKELM